MGDIRDMDVVRRALRGATHVHHNVAQVPLAKNPRLFWSVNYDGTKNILDVALEQGVEKVVYTSTSAVFGVPKSCPVTEATPPSPAEEYGRAKLEGEKLCKNYTERGLDVSTVRPRTILGHGRLGIFQILFEWVYEGRNVPVFNGGQSLYQFVHADDLADACVRAALRSGSETYNVGAKDFCSMRETLETLCRHAKTSSQVKSLPMAPFEFVMNVTSALGLSPLGTYHALMYGRSLYFDISKAVRELDWKPKYGNKEMICESYDWYVAHRDEVLTAKNRSAHRSMVKQGVLKLLKYII
jgi:nucleoside-diphosphate-sugar epimerase